MLQSRPVSWGIAAAVLLASPVVVEQIVFADDGIMDAAASGDVFVRDSAVAAERFALASRMEGLKAWDKAADVYGELLRDYADRVVPVTVDADGNAVAFVSVPIAVREKLGAWPEEGRAEYQARFEANAARDVLNAGDDVSALARVVDHYPITPSAVTAGTRLATLQIRRGEFAAASRVCQLLLRLNPNLPADDQAVLWHRIGLADHLSGDATAANAALAELKDNHADVIATVGGKEQPLAVALAETIANVATPQQRQGQDWPRPFGNDANSAVSAGLSSPDRAGQLARLFQVEIEPSYAADVRPAQIQEARQQNERDRKDGLLTGILPVVSAGQMFFNDNARVYALNLDSGQPLPGWLATYPGKGRYESDSNSTPHGSPCVTVVDGSHVLALIDQPDSFIAMRMGVAVNSSGRLVCLDRHTGAVQWSVRPMDLEPGAADQNLKRLQFAGAPVVVGERVFIVARGTNGNQFEDCYVVGLDLNTGALRTTSYLASANVMVAVRNGMQPILGAPSHPAANGGRVFVQTNVGAVASIDAQDGSVAWLSIYERDATDGGRVVRSPRMVQNLQSTNKPWEVNPLILRGNRVYALPDDTTKLLIFDTDTGSIVQRVDLKTLEEPNLLLAVTDKRIILSGDRLLWMLDREKIEAGTPAANAIIGKTTLVPGDMSEVVARPFVTTQRAYLPTRGGLVVASIEEGGRLLPDAPLPQPDENELPGNLLVIGDRLIDAGATAVRVWTDPMVIRQRLEEVIAKNPQDPLPRLEFAEVLLVAGENEPGLARLDEAVARLGNDQALAQRLFDTVLGLVPRSKNPHALMERAGSVARTPAQVTRLRLAEADVAKAGNDSEMELAALRAVLSDPKLREVPIGGNDGTTPAGDVARQRLAELRRRAGEAFAARLEVDATAATDAASGNAAQLMAVAEAHPLTVAAAKAVGKAAEIFEQQSQFDRAAIAYRDADRRLIQTTGTSAKMAGNSESLARVLARLPDRTAAAAGRLGYLLARDGDSPLAKPIILADGTPLQADTRAAAVAELLAAVDAQADARSPTLGLLEATEPELLDSKGAVLLAKEAKLVMPQADRGRPDRIAIWPGTSEGLKIFSPGSKDILATLPTRTAPMMLAYAGDRILMGDGVGLSVAREGAKPMRVSLEDVPVVGPIRADNAERAVGWAGTNEIAVTLTTFGRIIAWSHEGESPAVAWQANESDFTYQQIRASGDFVALAGQQPDGQSRLTVLDAASGRTVYKHSFQPNAPMVSWSLTDDGSLLWFEPSQVVGVDLYRPEMDTVFATTLTGRDNNQFGLAGSNGEGQLVVTGDRLLAVVDARSANQQIRKLDRFSGEPATVYTPEQDRAVPQELAPQSSATPLRLITDGQHVYTLTPDSLMHYRMDHPGEWWRAEIGPGSDYGQAIDMSLAKDAALLLMRTINDANPRDRGGKYRLLAFDRSTIRDKIADDKDADVESGLGTHIQLLANTGDQNGRALTWQVVNGGVVLQLPDETVQFFPTLKK